jgi:mono/diheme cytochrome c family protein
MRTRRCLLGSMVGGIVVLSFGMMRNVVAVQPQLVSVSSGSAATGASAERGRELYMRNCAVCHGASAMGMPHQGADLTKSNFVRDSSNDALVEFLRVGRKADDAKSVMKMIMPAKGGNQALENEHLVQIAAFLRDVQNHANEKSPTLTMTD